LKEEGKSRNGNNLGTLTYVSAEPTSHTREGINPLKRSGGLGKRQGERREKIMPTPRELRKGNHREGGGRKKSRAGNMGLVEGGVVGGVGVRIIT